MTRFAVYFLLVAAALPGVSSAQHSDVMVPIATDSRIKTFIYNENDVFSLMTHYGYQANVEFGEDEIIETVSIGDRVAFQIIPAGRRLFIRPMEEDARTNMTIITNERSYQFDLKSTGSPKSSREELVYVARFFYPDKQVRNVVQPHAYNPPVASVPAAVMPQFPVSDPYQATPTPALAAAPYPPALDSSSVGGVSAPVSQGYDAYNSFPSASSPPVSSGGNGGYNFLYSVSGAESLAPVKMYDDGRSTYISFRNMKGFEPELFEVKSDGTEVPLPYRNMGNALMVNKVLPRITVRSAGNYACIYNDTLVPMDATIR